MSESELKRAYSIGSYLVAADSGADKVLAAGLHPETVIGDFDSISAEARRALSPDVLHHIGEQDSTDFSKCLRSISCPLILGVGFAGARSDHHLANFNSLVRHPTQRCILLGSDDIAFLAPPSFALDLAPGTRVSLFPFGLVEGTSDGLEWPIAGLSFTPDGQIGTSNRATGPISLAFTAPKMLVILPSSQFEATADALLNQAATWGGS